MSDSYRLTIDVAAGDRRGWAVLIHLQELGLGYAIERLPEKPLTDLALRPYRHAGGEPLEEDELPADPDRVEAIRMAVEGMLGPSAPRYSGEGSSCALDQLIAAHAANPEVP